MTIVRLLLLFLLFIRTPFLVNFCKNLHTFSFSDSHCQPRFDHLQQQERHWQRRQVHRCRSCHCRSRRIRSRNWFSFRKLDHRLCSQPLPQTTTFLLRHFGIRLVRSHGSFLSYDGFLAVVRLLKNSIKMAHFSRKAKRTLRVYSTVWRMTTNFNLMWF